MSQATASLLGLFSVLLGLKQYFGDPIECLVKGVDKAFMERYCWVEGTFTLEEYTRDSRRGSVTNPGVGQLLPHHTVLDHSYYQWVPLVLACSAASFYVPRQKDTGQNKFAEDVSFLFFFCANLGFSGSSSRVAS